MDEDALAQKANTLQANGEKTFGVDCWGTMINAVGAAGVSQDFMRNLVSGANALGNFTQLSQEALLQQMQNARGPSDPNFRAADEAYRTLRDVQRAEHGKRR
jgi:hypothetical protein